MDASYSVDAVVEAWKDTTECNATRCSYPSTHPMDAHGDYTWKAMLQPHVAAGGSYTITVSAGASQRINITGVTYGDIYFCGGQSISFEVFARTRRCSRVFVIGWWLWNIRVSR
jgi:hypothetical protein